MIGRHIGLSLIYCERCDYSTIFGEVIDVQEEELCEFEDAIVFLLTEIFTTDNYISDM